MEDGMKTKIPKLGSDPSQRPYVLPTASTRIFKPASSISFLMYLQSGMFAEADSGFAYGGQAYKSISISLLSINVGCNN